MKKQFLFLSLIAFLSMSSVSVDASPPLDIGNRIEPTIKQTVAVIPQDLFVLTQYELNSFETDEMLIEDYSITSVKVDEDYTSCAMSAPVQDVQFVDTSTNVIHPIASMIDKRSIPQLNFNYIEGRATEYRS